MPTLVKSLVLSAMLLEALRAQNPNPMSVKPQFEVASLNSANGCENTPHSGSLSPSPGRLEMPCVTLQNLIPAAFGI